MESTADTPPATLRRSLPHRLRAAGIHVAVSGVVFLVALYLIVVRWYPGYHFYVDGGWQGVRLMIAVDLVLGPMLTLIVFNPFKARHLIVFDLACIGAAQVGALAWGFFAVHGQRPVSLNFYDGVVYSMPAHTLRTEPGAAAALERIGGDLIYVRMPANPQEWEHVKRRGYGSLLHEDAFFFEPLAAHWNEVQRYAIDPEHRNDPLLKHDLPGFLARHGGSVADYRFFRYQAGYGNCIIAFSAAGAPVDTLGCVAG